MKTADLRLIPEFRRQVLHISVWSRMETNFLKQTLTFLDRYNMHSKVYTIEKQIKLV